MGLDNFGWTLSRVCLKYGFLVMACDDQDIWNPEIVFMSRADAETHVEALELKPDLGLFEIVPIVIGVRE